MSTRVTPTELAEHLRALPAGRRHLVAVAGPPASGKSHLTDRLDAALGDRAAVVGMDGFHYDDAVLEARGRLPWKGAPDTFDVGGLVHLLARLRARDEDEVAVPVFDRTLEVSRGSAALVPRASEIVLVEGNWLLLGDAPWDRLADAFDVRVLVEVDEDELRRRLEDRWRGLGIAEDEVRRRVEENDLPNGRLVRERSVAVDLLVRAG